MRRLFAFLVVGILTSGALSSATPTNHDKATPAKVKPKTTVANCAGVAFWSASAVYVGGNKVVYGNRLYIAVYWNQGARPDINSYPGGPWSDQGECS